MAARREQRVDEATLLDLLMKGDYFFDGAKDGGARASRRRPSWLHADCL
jgi:hypothetical protein